MPQQLLFALLVVSKARHAILLCSAARECLFRGKILRDIFIRLRLVCRDNREGGEKSALLRGQSLGRMRSRRGYSLPPETGNRSDAFNCKASCLAFFLCNHLVSAASCQATLPCVSKHGAAKHGDVPIPSAAARTVSKRPSRVLYFAGVWPKSGTMCGMSLRLYPRPCVRP